MKHNNQIIKASKKKDYIFQNKILGCIFFFHSLTNGYKYNLLTFKILIIKLLDFSQ